MDHNFSFYYHNKAIESKKYPRPTNVPVNIWAGEDKPGYLLVSFPGNGVKRENIINK